MATRENWNRCNKKTILVDFGRVSFGNLELNIPEGATAPITVHFGEAFKDGRIDRKPPGTVRYNLSTIDPKGKTRGIAAPAESQPTKPRREKLII